MGTAMPTFFYNQGKKNGNTSDGKSWKQRATTIATVVVVSLFVLASAPAIADRVDEIQQEIEERSERIEEIEEDISKYEQELQEVRSEKQTLESRIAELQSTNRKLSSDVELTQARIDRAENTIREINLNIERAEDTIRENHDALKKAIRTLHELDQTTLVEKLLANNSLSDIWKTVDTLQAFQESIKRDLDEIRDLKVTLQEDKQTERAKISELENLRETYQDKLTIVQQNKRQQDRLLDQTESTESAYQAQLAEKRRQKELFQQQLTELESELNVAVDQSAIPSASNSTFIWPVDNIRITQQFGGTEFAKQNPAAYGRPFHNGTDFGVPTGTPIKSVRQGVVQASGNTDAVAGCYSYGKWVLVKHDNGLSSLYAHLSLIKAQPGQSVRTGDVIGYSGNTGYSTGPHLHLTVYASNAVQIRRMGDIKTNTNCGPARIPIAPLEAYLNPMKYLPGL